MTQILWQSPAPSTSFLRGVSVHLRARREIALVFEFEDENGDVRKGELLFQDVVHYRTTYLAALRAELIHEAYDCVLDMGTSPELREVIGSLKANRRTADVRHFRVCFDDGPCFDFIATAFLASTS